VLQCFFDAKSVFIAVNESLRWLNNVWCASFLAFYWSAGFWTFLQVSALASHWLEDCANVTPTPEENDHATQSQSLLVLYKQQANPLLSMYNYTPLAIGRYDKIKELT
jgi:hypothetical protein